MQRFVDAEDISHYKINKLIIQILSSEFEVRFWGHLRSNPPGSYVLAVEYNAAPTDTTITIPFGCVSLMELAKLLHPKVCGVS